MSSVFETVNPKIKCASCDDDFSRLIAQRLMGIPPGTQITVTSKWDDDTFFVNLGDIAVLQRDLSSGTPRREIERQIWDGLRNNLKGEINKLFDVNQLERIFQGSPWGPLEGVGSQSIKPPAILIDGNPSSQNLIDHHFARDYLEPVVIVSNNFNDLPKYKDILPIDINLIKALTKFLGPERTLTAFANAAARDVSSDTIRYIGELLKSHYVQNNAFLELYDKFKTLSDCVVPPRPKAPELSNFMRSLIEKSAF